MDVKIINDKNNVLLKRHEVKFEVAFEGATPSRLDVKNKIAALLNVPLDLVVVQKVNNEFGRQLSTAYAKIYETSERMMQIEKSHIIERNKQPEAENTEETEDVDSTE